MGCKKKEGIAICKASKRASEQKFGTAASISLTALAAVVSRSATSLSNSARKVSTSSKPSRDCAALALAFVGNLEGDRAGRGVVGEVTLRTAVDLADCELFRFAGADAGLHALSVKFPALDAANNTTSNADFRILKRDSMYGIRRFFNALDH